MITAAIVVEPVAIFFIVLVIIMLAPMLLNKLKIPHIIGMIVAGVVVGPYGFDILARDSSFAIFGQVGLLYLMFLAGLEIDMYHLRLNLKRGMAFGVLTLLIPLFLGVFTSVYVLHLDWLTAVLLGAMYASHTLISYPVAARIGITRSPAVLMSIVGTIVAVIGALIVLAATVNVKREGVFDISAILLMLGRLGFFCVATMIVYPLITRAFFKRYSDKVMQYVFVLALVFMAALCAQAIGMEAVLGAFFAGLVLNRFIPMGSPLMTSIEFVGNALFIPYFLISVGMMINVRVVLDVDTLYVAAIMLAVAFASKWLPAYIAQKLNKLSAPSRSVMFGLTAAHTAVALAVVTLGYNMGMLDEQVLNSTVLVILVTCAVAPLVTASAATRLKIEMMESDDGSGDDMVKYTRHNNTLVSVPTPLMTPALIELAVLMRNTRGTQNFYALHVRNENTNTAKAETRASLEEAAKAAALADIPIETIERYDINTVTGVLNTINERDITEVILGMHRRTTVIDSFFGSKIEQILDSSNKMLIISRCFIPLNTVTRIVVWAPLKAEYETGFSRWVRTIARLTEKIGCKVVFACAESAQPHILGVVYGENYGIRCEFRNVEKWDDFVLMSNKIADDDLFVVIGARVNSVSYDSSMVEMPQFLQRYFQHNNLLIIFPEQFGEEQGMTTFVDPLSSDIARQPSPWIRRIKGGFRKLRSKLPGYHRSSKKPHIDIDL